MTLLHDFLDPTHVSLKICGVTCQSEACALAEMRVDALGFNFWPQSKRHLPAKDAAWLSELRGQILRVGVFVNAPISEALALFEQGLIDAIQLHGDETADYAAPLRNAGIPFIKAFGVNARADLTHAPDFGSSSILLDAHVPGVYGGTGEVFDWNVAKEFIAEHSALPVILAGGITPENAALAARSVRPVALDVASGAEISPGMKDLEKVAALIAALKD